VWAFEYEADVDSNKESPDDILVCDLLGRLGDATAINIFLRKVKVSVSDVVGWGGNDWPRTTFILPILNIPFGYGIRSVRRGKRTSTLSMSSSLAFSSYSSALVVHS
jgi:hypothetical protein